MTGDRRIVWALIALMVFGAGLAGYYALHKPFAPEQAAHLAGLAADLGTALWITLLAGGVGRRLIPSPSFTNTGFALQAALGWGALAMLILALGMAGALYTWLVATLLVLATIVLWRDLLDWIRDVIAVLRALWLPDRWARFALVFVALTLGMGLSRALAPPLAWDAHVYHLTLPKWYAQLHHVRVDPAFMFMGMPQLNEMLFTIAYLVRGEIAAQTLGWAFGAVLTLGLAAYAHEVVGRPWGVLAPAIVWSSLTLALSQAWAYAELLLMVMALGVLIALHAWQVTQARGWLLIAGALSGLAMGCKYTGVIVPIASLALIVFHLWRGAVRAPSVTDVLRATSIFLLPAGLVFAPWLLKNALLTGNPFYPLVFPTQTMDAWRLWFYNRPDLLERNPLAATLILFRTVFQGAQGVNDYDATLGPLWAVLPVVLMLAWRRLDEAVRQALTPLVVFTLAGYVVWAALLFVSQYAVQARLFFAIFPALAVLCVAGQAALACFDSPRLRVSFIAHALTGLVLVLALVEHGLYLVVHSPFEYLGAAQSARTYREANLGWYAVAIDHVNVLPTNSRVLFLWEPRALDCSAIERCVPDAIIDRWYHLRRTLGSAPEIVSRWRAEGVTHVLIYDTGVEFVQAQTDSAERPDDWIELERLRAELVRVEDMGGVYSLYAVP